MPTWDKTPQFRADYDKLPDHEQELFMACLLEHFIPHVDGDPLTFPQQVRVKPMKGHASAWEMTWSFAGPDGRATFSWGRPQRPGLRHVIWRRVGYHGIYGAP